MIICKTKIKRLPIQKMIVTNLKNESFQFQKLFYYINKIYIF